MTKYAKKNVVGSNPFNDERHGSLEGEGGLEDYFQPGLNVLFNRLGKIFKRHRIRQTRELRHRLTAESADLTDCEVLQLVLDPVLEDVNPKVVAETLLKRFRTFGDVVNAPANRLMKVNGMNEAGAVALKTAGVAVVHMLRQSATNVAIFPTPESVMDYVTASLLYEPVEVFFVLFLDARHRLIKAEKLWHGAIDHVPLYPREVVRRCLDLDAVGIITAHKKMIGSRQATYQDIEITENVVTAAAVFGITVKDHIIVDRDGSFSMRAHDLL